MPRHTPTQDRANATVSKILDAAKEIIDDRGVFHLTTGAVAKQAGVSIGTVYRYFDDSVDIIDTIAPGLEELVQAKYHERRKEAEHGHLLPEE